MPALRAEAVEADRVTLLLVGVAVAAVFGLAVLSWFAAAARGDDLAGRYQNETDQWAAEIEGVPLDWLDELDDIRRLPERAA